MVGGAVVEVVEVDGDVVVGAAVVEVVVGGGGDVVAVVLLEVGGASPGAGSLNGTGAFDPPIT